MKHFSECVYKPGFVKIVLMHGNSLQFNYEAFAWCEQGVQFKIICNNSVFVPYSAIAYIQFVINEVKDNA